MASTTVHIYDKRFRWLIQGAGLFSAIWFMSGLWQPLALGAALFVFSALSIKEYFCFKVKILLLTPVALAGFWFCLVFNVANAAIGLAIVGAALLHMPPLVNGACRYILISVIRAVTKCNCLIIL
ncbi:hypothetical protein [Photobacterium kishitanii]|uniref:hypothetical protein n=1 Tax=Photobacterium kishitanii TaxID=318456 RepID=UPI00273858C1|nr:hypothetical protein [Photobacterium kishitanii]